MENELMKRNYYFAKKIEELIFREKNLDKRLDLIEFYSQFVANNQIGMLHCVNIENHLLEIANRFEFIYGTDQKRKSLIIMTKAYPHGGHTRIVEHLVKYSDDNSYDLVFTRKNIKVPDTLQFICKDKCCDIYVLKGTSILDKAQELRMLGVNYNNILLHIHPEDFLPIISFGCKDWETPIFLYNHAEHRPWFGVTITDVVMDLSSKAKENTMKYRCAKKSEVLPMPIVEAKRNEEVNIRLREKMGIELDAIVFFSAGSEYKFSPNGEIDFKDVVEMVLDEFANSYFVIIGINREKNWKKLKNKYQNRLLLIKQTDYLQYLNYVNLADIYIDSMPVSGFTVLLEMALRKIPIIFLKTKYCFPDSIIGKAIEYKDLMIYIKEIVDNNFQQDIDMQEHKIEYFIKKHNEIIINNRNHTLNIIRDEVVDFSDESYLSFILKSVYANKTNIKNIGILPFRYRILVNLMVLQLFIPLINKFSTGATNN